MKQVDFKMFLIFLFMINDFFYALNIVNYHVVAKKSGEKKRRKF